jgi:hypothetical protein
MGDRARLVFYVILCKINKVVNLLYRISKVQNLIKALAYVVVAVSSGFTFADTAVISQNGSPQVSVFPSQNGDETAPYLLGVVGTGLTTLDVSLALQRAGSFNDFATFNIASPSIVTLSGNPVTSTIGTTVNSGYTDFYVSLFQGNLAPSGNPLPSANLIATMASPTSQGSYTSLIAPGNYFIQTAGVGFAINSQPGYHVDLTSVPAVPEAETYAMMLAGLGAVNFFALRRKKKLIKA